MSTHNFLWEREFETDVNPNAIEEYTIEYEASGQYRPAKLNAPMEDCYPAEYPEIEIQSVTDANGFDIWKHITGKTVDKLQELAQDNYDNLNEDY